MYNVWWASKEPSSNSKGILKDEDWIRFIREFEEVKGRTNLRKSHIYIFLKSAYGENKFVSRYNLKDILKLSETSTRTFLKKMVTLNVAGTIKGGHHLTLYGRKLAEYIMKKIKEISVTDDMPFHYKHSWGAAVNHPFKIERLFSLRDGVIRNGGEAALILLVEDKEVLFPESRDRLSNYNEKLANNILEEVKGFDCRFVIIAFSNDLHTARLSALDTALDYIEWE